MKYALILVLLSLSTRVFALPCPNGSGVLYKGDALSEVIKECGEPLTQSTNTRTLYTLQEWTYYLRHAYDPGYSQLIVSFKNGIVMNIRVKDYFWTPIC